MRYGVVGCYEPSKLGLAVSNGKASKSGSEFEYGFIAS